MLSKREEITREYRKTFKNSLVVVAAHNYCALTRAQQGLQSFLITTIVALELEFSSR